jgi:nucleotide-binding universal stress UspA family protein
MSIATLLVHVDTEGELNGHVQLAAQLADRLQSVLIGAAAQMPRPAFVVEGVTVDPGPTESDLADMQASLARRGEQFQAAVRGPQRHTEWRSALEFPTEFIAREARAADLLVIRRERSPYDPYRYADAGALILRAGRPVLVVPPRTRSLAGRRVAIAWKDTREARRAVTDALPFLHAASEVVLLEVCEQDDQQQAAQRRLRDVSAYLSRHRILTVAERVRPVDGTPFGTLLRLVEEESIDLIVAGAYGHSRLGEWIFGGMTQDLLTGCPVCCLFSH